MSEVTTTAKANLTTTAQISTTVRSIDFVTRFGKQWDALSTILGIVLPVRKAPGTRLVSYTADIDGNLNGGATVGEGEEIPYTKTKVIEAAHDDITVEKYAKAVTIEAVNKYGAVNAIQRTDTAFLNALQHNVLDRFYTFLKGGKLIGNQKTWQKALAVAKGAVLNRFAGSDMTVTEVVGFANIMDAYSYLGDANVTVQTQFGISYVENFLGYKTLLLLPDEYIEQGIVIAVPTENINLYYVDPADSDFAALGLEYIVQGETNLVGFHAEGDYKHAVGEVFAIMGMLLWAEYLDGIAVVSVDDKKDAALPAVTPSI